MIQNRAKNETRTNIDDIYDAVREWVNRHILTFTYTSACYAWKKRDNNKEMFEYWRLLGWGRMSYFRSHCEFYAIKFIRIFRVELWLRMYSSKTSQRLFDHSGKKVTVSFESRILRVPFNLFKSTALFPKEKQEKRMIPIVSIILNRYKFTVPLKQSLEISIYLINTYCICAVAFYFVFFFFARFDEAH